MQGPTTSTTEKKDKVIMADDKDLCELTRDLKIVKD